MQEIVQIQRFPTAHLWLHSAFAFASLGVNEDVMPAGVYCFRINDSVYHTIGRLHPNGTDERPKFAQMYIYNTEHKYRTDITGILKRKDCHRK